MRNWPLKPDQHEFYLHGAALLQNNFSPGKISPIFHVIETSAAGHFWCAMRSTCKFYIHPLCISMTPEIDSTHEIWPRTLSQPIPTVRWIKTYTALQISKICIWYDFDDDMMIYVPIIVLFIAVFIILSCLYQPLTYACTYHCAYACYVSTMRQIPRIRHVDAPMSQIIDGHHRPIRGNCHHCRWYKHTLIIYIQ